MIKKQTNKQRCFIKNKGKLYKIEGKRVFQKQQNT